MTELERLQQQWDAIWPNEYEARYFAALARGASPGEAEEEADIALFEFEEPLEMPSCEHGNIPAQCEACWTE